MQRYRCFNELRWVCLETEKYFRRACMTLMSQPLIVSWNTSLEDLEHRMRLNVLTLHGVAWCSQTGVASLLVRRLYMYFLACHLTGRALAASQGKHRYGPAVYTSSEHSRSCSGLMDWPHVHCALQGRAWYCIGNTEQHTLQSICGHQQASAVTYWCPEGPKITGVQWK
jgi:hypothetical protein